MYYGGQKTPTFSEIINTDGTDVTIREKFKEIISASSPVTLIGIRLDCDIYIIEGMHRATAISLAADRGIGWSSAISLYIARSDLPVLDTID